MTNTILLIPAAERRRQTELIKFCEAAASTETHETKSSIVTAVDI